MTLCSPPYYNLRDYGHPDQIGLESSSQDYIDKLISIFQEVKRVLKKEGSCWVVISDSYNSNKSLSMIPERFAISMIDHNWILRNKIIWYKPNCMPSSVRDRFTVDWEYLYFFTKSERYYFDTQYEPINPDTLRESRYTINLTARKSQETRQGLNKWKPRKDYHKNNVQSPLDIKSRIVSNYAKNEVGRIKRSVWKISPQPFKEAHFAVYPEKLCETPIKAGCPINGTVLDPFMGAGTTGLVALKLARNFIGIELNPDYIRIAEKRLKPYLEQLRLVY